MIGIPLNINIFERGDSGVPTNSLLCDLGGRTEEHEHTIGASIGFESMTEALTVTQDEAIDWLENGLGRSVIVYGPDAEIVWEGFLSTVEAQIGQETRSISLDELANRIIVRSTDQYGTSTLTADNDSDSRATYGLKIATYSRDFTDSGTATVMATTVLTERAWGVKKYKTVIETGAIGGAALRLGFSGWYTTLGWVTYTFANSGAGNASTTLTSTTTQVQTLLTDIATINPFISTNYGDITASGQTDTEFIGTDTTYRTKIEALLKSGNSSSQRQCWGVYEDRRFRVVVSASATPTIITYQRSKNERVVRDNRGNRVPPWLVRPDAMYQMTDLLDVMPNSAAPDSAARSFVERTSCRITRDAVSLRLEGQGGDTLDDVLARLRG